MSEGCAFSQAAGTRRICGLLGAKDLDSAVLEGHVIALREIVEHFQIEWEIAPQSGGNSCEESASGFALALRGRHEPAGDCLGQTCAHCANLMLSLRIIGEWLVPPGGRCAFCQAEASNAFVRGDGHSQGEASSARTLCVWSGPGTACQLAECQELCMREIRERLALLGAAERRRFEP
jgi:hypothetical protein